MPGILADPDAIAALGAAFLDAADRLEREAAAAVADAHLAESAFGHLPASQEVHQRYERQLATTDGDLRGLLATLRAFGANLRTAADNYAEADQTSA